MSSTGNLLPDEIVSHEKVVEQDLSASPLPVHDLNMLEIISFIFVTSYYLLSDIKKVLNFSSLRGGERGC
jgi:hypothetical protein